MSQETSQETPGDGNNEAPSAMRQVNLALKECGFGLFHLQLLFTSFLGFVSGVIVLNSTPYILPIAECDLKMTLLQKGVLNAMPFLGMMLTSIIAGFLTDIFGRKRFITCGFSGLFIFTVISGTSQTYLVFVISKFFEGVLSSISFSPMVTMTSEFCHSDMRDRIMLLQSSFAAIAQVIVALMAWAILPQDWNYSFFNGAFVLHTWNFYLFIMSLWSLSATVMYLFLPESPKYYITQERYDEAREILIKIYKRNTGKQADNFPYKNLWKDTTELVIDEVPVQSSDKSFLGMLSTGLQNIKPMFQKPHGGYLLIFCLTMFFSMFLYNIIRLWFPQLSTIVEHYSSKGSQDLCIMLDSYTDDLKFKRANVTNKECVPTMSGTETYVNSVILGAICVVPYIFTSILVNKVGKKNFYIFCGIIATGTTLGLRWASSRISLVALFAIDESATQMMKSLNQALVVEFFPTTMRTLAVATLMTIGRVGSLVGNVLFPILLSLGCVLAFYTLAVVMLGTTLLSFLIPAKKETNPKT